MPYSTRCSTPLSNFESNQNYKETMDPSGKWPSALTADTLLAIVLVACQIGITFYLHLGMSGIVRDYFMWNSLPFFGSLQCLGEVLQEKLGGGVWPASQNPYPI